MLSDDSSSDSETGRFKGQAKPEEDNNAKHRDDSFRSSGRSRHSDNDRFRREFDRKRNERDGHDKYSRDRHRYSRHSPVSRRRHSRDRSPRRSDDRHRRKDTQHMSKPRDGRSSSKDRRKRSRSQSYKEREISKPHKPIDDRIRSHRSPDNRRDLKEEIKRNIEPITSESQSEVRSKEKISERRSKETTPKRVSESPEYRNSLSQVHKPAVAVKKRSISPIVVDHDSDKSEEVQLGSYYKMIPAVVKEKDKLEESSEIDSSDDERLRAKLLNLEKELQKTKKKKRKRKHRKRSSKGSKDKDESISAVEVTSTTDIQEETNDGATKGQVVAVPEVSSTQKVQKESSEEGEISSDEDTQDSQEDYDPSDLRHKLRRSKTDTTTKSDVCGPALPPHLERRVKRSASVEIEGPALPPHLQNKTKNIGPSIPSDMRRVLAEQTVEVVEEHSSEEDVGIGPLPVGAEGKWSDAHQKLEERALDIKIKKLDGRSLDSQKVKSREQWMLELPEGKAKYLGLEARSFRAKAGPDMSDRSSWTDTPEEKARKEAGIAKEVDADEAMRRDARARQIANRDEEQESAIKKHKKKHKREESLLEIHEKKLKKKKKKDEKDDDKKERRPFSRDVDLQVNRFDDAQKKSIIKKAQGLNNRFSRGEAKFL